MISFLLDVIKTSGVVYVCYKVDQFTTKGEDKLILFNKISEIGRKISSQKDTKK